MKKLKIVFILSFLSFSVMRIYSQSTEHLEPLDKTFSVSERSSGANSKIAQVIQLDSYDFTIRFIKVPSFSVAGILDLYFDQEKYFLIYLEGEEVYKTEIDSISAEQIKFLFKTAILATQYKKEPEDGISIDGESFFFFINEKCNYGIKGGQTWSPHRNTPMWKLVTITKEFIELAKAEKLVVFTDIQKERIKELEEELIRKE